MKRANLVSEKGDFLGQEIWQRSLSPYDKLKERRNDEENMDVRGLKEDIAR